MMEIRPYICKCCGGRINVAKMRCEFCDTDYEDNSLKRIKIETVQPGVHTIAAQIEVSFDHMAQCPEHARDYALSELRKQLADGLLGFMKLETTENFSPKYWERTQIIRGTVRVVDPTFDNRW